MAKSSFFSLQHQFVDRPLRVLAGLLSLITTLLPDGYRAAFGRFLVGIIQRWKFAELPTSDELTADKTEEVARNIQVAMDAIGEDGQRGGWKAGHAVLEAARKPGEALDMLPEGLMITVLMGLPGIKTPQTSFLAMQLLHKLKQQYYETGQPNYLFAQVVEFAEKKLIEADNAGNWLSDGILKSMFAARVDPSLGHRAREAAVLMFFQQNDEYKKFLRQDADGSFSLPAGKTYEEFAAAMLANAYGPYPF